MKAPSILHAITGADDQLPVVAVQLNDDMATPRAVTMMFLEGEDTTMVYEDDGECHLDLETMTAVLKGGLGRVSIIAKEVDDVRTASPVLQVAVGAVLHDVPCGGCASRYADFFVQGNDLGRWLLNPPWEEPGKLAITPAICLVYD